jgi:general secretion pathway protein G
VSKKEESRSQKAVGRSSSRFLFTAHCSLPTGSSGFSLIELVITITVLAILTLGTVPLVQVSVKRQKEQELHEALRTMREAIDQFHREAIAGAQLQITQQQTGQGRGTGTGTGTGTGGGANPFTDPRVRVGITDQTIFTAENIDRYPPDLETLIKGVDVLPLTTNGAGGRGNADVNATSVGSADSVIPKTKVYLRRIPVDPMTGNADWCVRSSYDPADTGCGSGGGENVFDVRSKSKGTALNGEKYSDW